jgi:type IV pilus assembly protein PilB
VLSTLHTNSAAETVTRLLNMGVPSFNLATSVNLIIAQRLARRLCKECSVPADDIPKEVLLEHGFTEEQLATANIRRAVGCDHCTDGYKGRLGIYEVVRITPSIAQLILAHGNAMDIHKQARAEGFRDLHQSALIKVANGLTSLEEINRVTTD